MIITIYELVLSNGMMNVYDDQNIPTRVMIKKVNPRTINKPYEVNLMSFILFFWYF